MVALHVMMVSIYRLGYLLPLTMLGILTPALAQVPTTITPDGSLGTTVSQSGSVHTIDGGTILGPNQFHSFDRFNVSNGDTVSFTGPASVENILSRVTGGSQSMIDGTLQSDIAGAHLYLLNPSGVMFGPNAQLDVMGSFYASTADVLRFADGSAFHTNLGRSTVLTVAAPAAFGFLSQNPNSISIRESEIEMPEEKTFSLVGGDIEIEQASLHLPSGQIQIVSVASLGEVQLSDSAMQDFDLIDFNRLGKITIEDLTFIDASGDRGGSVTIHGRQIRVGDSAFIDVETQGDIDGAAVAISMKATDTMAIEGLITSSAFGAGAGGSIILSAENLDVEGGITSSAFGAGASGSINQYCGQNLGALCHNLGRV